MNSNVNIVIFSKDRANQVTACVRSLLKHFKEAKNADISVLYKSTSKDYLEGYKRSQKLLQDVSNLSWHAEHNFLNQTRNLVNNSSSPLTMFLVDDIIFVDDFSMSDKQFSFLEMNAILALSLRLHDGVNVCYATQEEEPVPKFTKQCVWDWRTQKGDWAYPLSVDGNVYRTDLIKQLVNQLQFNNPNMLEAALDSAKHSTGMPTLLCCYPEQPKLINIPANRVQNVYKNRYAKGYSAEELNQLFLEGKSVDFEQYANIKPQTVHVPVELELKNEL